MSSLFKYNHYYFIATKMFTCKGWETITQTVLFAISLRVALRNLWSFFSSVNLLISSSLSSASRRNLKRLNVEFVLKKYFYTKINIFLLNIQENFFYGGPEKSPPPPQRQSTFLFITRKYILSCFKKNSGI